MRSILRTLSLALCLTLCWAPTFGAASQLECGTLLAPKVSFERLNGDFLKANGVAITGEFLYPLEVVLNNFDLQNVDVRTRYKGKNVLSLAEGVSGFLPYLLENGVNAKALDLWYHTDSFPNNYSGQLMRDYVSRYGERLIQGDARQIPLPDESVDAVFSHMLVNNVNLVRQKAILRDVIRVLKHGGEARLYGFDDSDTKLMRTFLTTNFGGLIAIDFKEISYSLDFRGNRTTHSLNLLIINKLMPQ